MGLDGTWLLELYGLSDQLQHPQENDGDEYGFTWPSNTLSDQVLDAQNAADQDRESPQVGRGSDDEASQAVDVSRSRRATSPPCSPPNPSQRRILQWFEDLPAQYDAFAEAVANSPVDLDPAFQSSDTSADRYPSPAQPIVAHGPFHQGQFVPVIRGQANAQPRAIGTSSADVNLRRHRSELADPSLFMSRDPAHPTGPFPQFHQRQLHRRQSVRRQPHQGPFNRGQSHREQPHQGQYRDGPFQRGQFHREQPSREQLPQGWFNQG